MVWPVVEGLRQESRQDKNVVPKYKLLLPFVESVRLGAGGIGGDYHGELAGQRERDSSRSRGRAVIVLGILAGEEEEEQQQQQQQGRSDGGGGGRRRGEEEDGEDVAAADQPAHVVRPAAAGAREGPHQGGGGDRRAGGGVGEGDPRGDGGCEDAVRAGRVRRVRGRRRPACVSWPQ
ncbi:hypothetical protein DAI22_11g211300 [Oryza sativa Japonica Group]|nr:hypothetical protein DAI22_11g211300 [Oryza sativa Japonica Group]